MFIKVIIASLCLVVFFIVGTFILDFYNTEPAAINSDIAITEETKDIRDGLAGRDEIFHEDNIAGETTYANNELSQISSPPENDLKEMINDSEEFDLANSDDFNEIPPSSDNITMPPEGEFKDEIDQKYINEQARAAGYYYDNPSPESPEPTKENTNDLAEGELNYEIDQQQILEEAKMEGSEIPAVNYNTPDEFNVLAEPAGEYSDQVSDSQID